MLKIIIDLKIKFCCNKMYLKTIKIRFLFGNLKAFYDINDFFLDEIDVKKIKRKFVVRI